MMIATRSRGRVGAGGTSAPAPRSFAGPDVGVAALVAGDPPERVRRGCVVLLDRAERVVEEDRVALEAQVVEALGDVDRGHRIASYRRDWRSAGRR